MQKRVQRSRRKFCGSVSAKLMPADRFDHGDIGASVGQHFGAIRDFDATAELHDAQIPVRLNERCRRADGV